MKKGFYQPYFENKKITIMGLGLLGRGLQVTKFLTECKAKVTVTDLKNEKDLAISLKKLKGYKIKYVLGKHNLEDFENTDLVIKSAGVPLDSPFIKHARLNKIPVAMDASIFAKIVSKVEPKITIIGITGTRGKSMTTALIYHILSQNEANFGCKVHLGGNMRMKATLPILSILKPKDIVVLELDSWQCQGFGDEKISPHISVFTNLMSDHMNYYKGSMKKYLTDKENIFKFQNKNDILVTDKENLKTFINKPKSKIIIANIKNVPKITMNIFGQHNIKNISYAYSVAKELGLSDTEIIKTLKSFGGLEGRLQYIGKTKEVLVINDNNATTPEATVAGIKSVYQKYGKKFILICGGADKGLKISDFAKNIKKYCKKVVLIPGNGTERLKKLLKNYIEEKNMKSIISESFLTTKKNDVILFSPGFASFGLFKNEYDRNDQFLNLIKKWK